MTLNEIRRLLNADVPLDVGSLDAEIHTAFASDLMSDTLAYADHWHSPAHRPVQHTVLRTAEMLDIPAIIFVRGKKPTDEMLELAREDHVCILQTGYSMYAACGILYNAGLEGGFLHER